MEYNRNSPNTSGGNTPTFPAGTEGNFNAGMNPQMAGMAGISPNVLKYVQLDESDRWDDARGSGDGEYAAKYGGGGWVDAAQEPSDT